ncbi:PspC domain-containing protein [Cytophagales bacterium LB-30]|uniref:PspC domain-containing protein n=1 Tax=Shiella aurantiaca TaxID=3058365 RepID=A0ABT8F7Q5_9BACT|nr:PspC domain-containing protein [Shiella aurantiaca]MDN4166472.1 PspC domain-containing protein [Shiella aurantiaca]
MKKNISINISGIIFHIEEDGYDQLKQYLDAIHTYFASFDGSEEIIQDIESRIAEIFSSKLNAGKQVITLEDVEALQATMGGVKDFQAIEEDEPLAGSTQSSAKSAPAPEPSATGESKRFYRDVKRKMLGGVAAGIAHYFSFDALWVRVALVLLAVSGTTFWFIGGFSISGVVILGYILAWILVPESHTLQEDEHIKKLYRNPDTKVLGGVASGIASYFKVDVVIIRILFVLFSIPGGAGIIAYIIMWAITPEAKSFTEKMQMSGEPVTLSNIENKIKRDNSGSETAEENVITKIILFPFRVIAAVFGFLAKAIGPVFNFFFDVVRIFVGFMIFIMGFSFLVTVLIMAGVFLGLYTGEGWLHLGGLPTDLFIYSIPWPVAVSAALLFMLPTFAITMGGISIMTRKQVLPRGLGFTLFMAWLISLGVLAISIPNTIKDFHSEATHTVRQSLEVGNSIPVFTSNSRWDDDVIPLVQFKIKPSNDSLFYVIKETESFGSTVEDAMQNAQSVEYVWNQTDSVFFFPNVMTFAAGAEYRFQTMDVILEVPRNRPFVLEYSINSVLQSYPYHVSSTAQWIYTDEGLRCLTCEEDSRYYDGFSKSYDELTNFTSIEANDYFDIQINQSDSFSVRIDGDRDILSHTELYVSGTTLYLDIENDHWFDIRYGEFKNRVKVYIDMPALRAIELSGAVEAELNNFTADYLDIELHGASNLKGELTAESIDVEIHGASSLQMDGKADKLAARVKGASRLLMVDFPVNQAYLDANGASSIEVQVKDILEVETSGASQVGYKGSPRVEHDGNGISGLRKL